jgi:hypothetical protein
VAGGIEDGSCFRGGIHMPSLQFGYDSYSVFLAVLMFPFHFSVSSALFTVRSLIRLEQAWSVD